MPCHKWVPCAINGSTDKTLCVSVSCQSEKVDNERMQRGFESSEESWEEIKEKVKEI